jgi:hypothetical protein
VVLLPGYSVPSYWIPRPIQNEVAQCQRYYSKSYSIEVTPGTASARGFSFGEGVATTAAVFGVGFPVEMRTSPTMKIYGFDGTADKIFVVTSGANAGTTVTCTTQRTSRAWDQVADSGTGFTDGEQYGAHWTADAEL